ncbi:MULTISPECIES: murein biosynthesis integral membrane protein MurJ [unclassified Acinetobacter]|uniref:murein biosynthesis integral membrane protein MurJ n=1 Tax=unclassified Acinetobacter TaxID=196816 RepID=UPI0015D372C8
MGFFKIFFSLIGLTLLSKVLGFLREILLSYYYGVSNIIDAYLVALTIPGVLFSFFSVAISVSFIPVFSKVYENTEERNNFVNNILNIFILVSSFIVVLTFIFAEYFVYICAPGFDEETKSLAIKFTRIFVVGVYFSCWISIFSAFLNFFKKFTLVALAGIPFNLTILLSIILSFYYGVYWLILGAVFGKLFEIIFLYPYIRKMNYSYKFYINLKDENARKIAFLSMPLIFSVAVNQINIIVDKSIASTLQVGAISAINYSHYLIELVIGIFVLTTVTIFFPDLAKSFNNKDKDAMKAISEKSFSIINLFVIPCCIFFIFQTKKIISFVYERGGFDTLAVNLTSDAFFFFSIGLLGLAYREILLRIYYAMHNTIVPVFNSIIGVLLNIILALLLSKYYGISGLALATSISAFLTAFLLFLNLRKLNINLNSISILKCSIKKLSAAIFSILFLFFVSETIFLPLNLIIYFLSYIFFLFLLKDRSVLILFNKLKGKMEE